MNLKQKLYQSCETLIEERFQAIQKTIEELQKALLSETKSSAGDKHETGRAMLQLEREKTGQQLAEINKTKIVLSKVNLGKQSNVVTLGSLVYTSQSNYFIAISAGNLVIDNESFYAISANTPIGKLLIGKTKGDNIDFNGNSIEIKKIE
ncbi:3-oxoacyl-ACP synthase [Flavobacteriaceae bacterium S0825]|uniref:3-oxoacyl-ACP synthase n=1 Tax=Gaetbulibacter sp. S0825 TaxID=2720084 RepID=UPI001430E24A|nr:3-oxoacyl-ACP synthase [Gaetbulibacter sp. S0825]MCK0108206.1 3-oxoacyl-ACP synthase [Flavobacteriaceae bacterium S0825]NIX63842.1 3-oxoacyl-ACP synthase [Gaetbulibacter sp. S0825]